MLKFTLSKFAIFILALFVISNSVFAETITFTRTDFLVSTTETSATLSSNPTSVPTIPVDETFTLEPNSNNLYLNYNQGKFLRFDFTLPSTYANLDFLFTAIINDAFALYINDSVAAIQSDAAVVNFETPLPGFHLDSAGNAIDTSPGKLNYLLTSGMQSFFQTGVNELTIYGRDINNWGGFDEITGVISYNTTEPPPNPVPEPSTMLLTCISLVGLARVRRKFRK
ncbi:MAG: PEP-CTERM sorting domain-containing protein [Deltaproteobacteria bacterium]|nr:PEP-CTERM sorting domain-containing protein [Deltaproteobacteria bacterium]